MVRHEEVLLVDAEYRKMVQNSKVKKYLGEGGRNSTINIEQFFS
jgi:hypothetical protein